MKKFTICTSILFLFATISVLMILILPSKSFSQSLNSNASYIKTNYASAYEATLKKHALEEWGQDYSMVLYEINKQADALMALISEFESDNTNIVFRAIQEWSIEGYKASNITKFKSIDTFGLKQLIDMHCDWSMVKYEYDKQGKAKNSF